MKKYMGLIICYRIKESSDSGVRRTISDKKKHLC